MNEEDVALLEVGEGGNGGQVILRKDSEGPVAVQGYGEVHHVSFRVKDHEAIKHWIQKYQELGIPNSGFSRSFYFEALYARIGHILLEFQLMDLVLWVMNPMKRMGEKLSLPPF